MSDLARQFEAGGDDYWRGQLPEKWNDPDHRAVCAYCTGWYLESMSDLDILPEQEDCGA